MLNIYLEKYVVKFNSNGKIIWVEKRLKNSNKRIPLKQAPKEILQEAIYRAEIGDIPKSPGLEKVKEEVQNPKEPPINPFIWKLYYTFRGELQQMDFNNKNTLENFINKIKYERLWKCMRLRTTAEREVKKNITKSKYKEQIFNKYNELKLNK